ncbi:MAG: CoA transferase [Propionibacteriales bacterium]|nr:CoA transferase [Propionibacteriales bacterium]
MSTQPPLDGVRVVDFSRVLAGPYCTMNLGDLGADVVKVERPDVGDDLRSWGPPFAESGESTYFMSVNRNKRSLVADLRSEEGLALARELVAGADVVVENFRPGVMDSLGLGYDDASAGNPGLVYCSITGFGDTGPLRTQPGYDVILQAMTGLMSVTGEPDGDPMRVGVAIIDIATGLYALSGILAALHARERDGRGQRLDLSLLSTGIASLPNHTAGYLVAGAEPGRLGNQHPNVAPYGVFSAADGDLVLACGTDQQWSSLCALMGHPEAGSDERFRDNRGRVVRRDEVQALLEEWFSTESTASLAARLTEAGIPAAPIQSVPAAVSHEQVDAAGLLADFTDQDGAATRLVGNPLTMSAADLGVRRPPPRLGEHTTEVALDLGWSAHRIAQAVAIGALQESRTRS